jgi:hypothetical protein
MGAQAEHSILNPARNSVLDGIGIEQTRELW